MNNALFLLFFLNISLRHVSSYLHLELESNNPPFESSFYEQFLDSEQCSEQMAIIRNDTLLAMQFIESGLRIPKGILKGNLVDLGNYFQCIEIDEQRDTFNIEGKYCQIDVPINQQLSLPALPSLPEWPDIEWPEWLPEIDFNVAKLRISDENVMKLRNARKVEAAIEAEMMRANTIRPFNNDRSVEGTSLENLHFTLAVCVPKVCTTEQWMNSFLFNTSAVGFEYSEISCRVKGDKVWVTADYVAVVVFSILGFVTILSTGYDLWHSFIKNTDPKQINQLRRSFSLYTNCRRLTTFAKVPGALECVDGIRALSMAWVILGHSFSTLPSRVNTLEAVNWTLSINSTWVTAAPICVDTFFMLSGLLLVYTTARKLTGIKLLKNLHLFYLNRILRMFPLLAAAVLIQASFMYRLYDGPVWTTPASNANNCRTYWWSTLLYIQNYANSWNMCLPHTWYLAIDMQLHILSPLVLFWVLSGKKSVAWISMSAALLAVLAGASAYIFINEFPGAVITATRGGDYQNYMIYYYFNTLTRSAPFFVGMLFGYLLHLCRNMKIRLSKINVTLLWILAIGMMLLGVFSSHPPKNADWDNQTVDSFLNSYARAIWAAGVAWVIFACQHGYGGPANWFLSLQMWKLLSRLSYGMYIYHYPFMYLSRGATLQPIFFSVARTMHRFIAEFAVAFMVAFGLTVFVDSPFSTIFKLMLEGPKKDTSAPETKKGNGDLYPKINNDSKENQYCSTLQHKTLNRLDDKTLK